MTFEVIPAIDLRGGHAVRLLQGDYDQETRYSADPIEVAQRWADLGAPRLHVVDLDGARGGAPTSRDLMARICASIDVPVEVSGGMRTFEIIAAAFDYGADRVQIGSAAVRNPALVERACAAYPGRITVSLDSKSGEVVTDGWEQGSGVSVLDLAKRMVAIGVPRIMATDVARDGAMQGPNIETYRDLVGALSVPIVASGGVTSVEHLRELAAAGCEGAVIGRALYEGTLDLSEALASMGAC